MVRKLKNKAQGGGQKKILKQAMEAQQKMGEIQDKLKEKKFEASAGGGAVKSIVNGHKELEDIKISPDVVDPDDVEMLEDLIISSLKEAMRQADEAYEKEMQDITGGLPLPGLF